MKNLSCTVSLVLVFVFGLAVGAMAYPYEVSVGDSITFGNGIGNTAGGEFIVKRNGSALFKTFCLETDEFLNFSDTFIVSNISDSAQSGGSNTNSGDPISDQTRWLYWNYSIGTLNSLVTGYSYGSALSADALQVAIWTLEEETLFNIVDRAAYTATQVFDLSNLLITAANDAVANKAAFGNVAVLNMTYTDGRYAQDVLVAEPVPEPGTLVLLGAGLAGLGLFGRRRMKR